MSDEITVRDEGGKPFPQHPEGQYQGVCVDVIDLGDKPESFNGGPLKIVHKGAIVYQTREVNPDTGKLFEIAREFTLSMGEKAALRKYLGVWRGKSYSDEEAKAGTPLHKLVGVNAALTIEHKTSAKGNVYANILNAATWPKEAPKRSAEGYVRDAFWAKRKQEYAAATAAFRAQNGAAPPSRTPDEVLASVGAEDDGLAF